MARLKIKEILSNRLVKPEEGHKPPISPQRKTKSGGFKEDQNQNSSNSQKIQSKSFQNIFPALLTEETDQTLASLASKLVKDWGDRALSSIELEDYIATAAEKTPTQDENIKELRNAIKLIKDEYCLLYTSPSPRD